MNQNNQKKSKGLFDTIIDSMAFFSGIILLVITIMITYSVITRYLRLPTPIWVLQFTEYGLLWMTFLGAAWLLKLDGHIRIDTLLSHLPLKTQKKLEIVNDLLGCLVTLVIVIYGIMHTADLFQRGILEVKATNIPKYLLFWIVPFGGLALFLQFVRSTIQKLFQNPNP